MSAHTPGFAEIAQMFIDWDSIGSVEFDAKYPGVSDEMRSRTRPAWDANDAFNTHCRDLFRQAITKASPALSLEGMEE